MKQEHFVIPLCSGVVRNKKGRVDSYTLYLEQYNAYEIFKPDIDIPVSTEQRIPLWLYRVILHIEYCDEQEVLRDAIKCELLDCIKVYEDETQGTNPTRHWLVQYLYNKLETIPVEDYNVECIPINTQTQVYERTGIVL